jgi:hypothetical protein
MAEFKIEHNVATDEIVEIPLTDKEIKELEKIRAAEEAAQIERNAIAAQKAAEKAAVLSRLGLTEDELKTILG